MPSIDWASFGRSGFFNGLLAARCCILAVASCAVWGAAPSDALSIEDAIREAQAALDADRPETAVRIADRVLNGVESRVPRSGVLRLLRGEAQLALGDPESALDDAIKAGRIDRLSNPADELRGACLAEMGDWKSSLGALDAVPQSSLSDSGLLLLAEGLVRNGDQKRARRILTSIEGRAPSASQQLGVLAYERGMFREAIAHFRRTTTRSPEDYYSRIYVARALLELGETVAALKELDEGIRFVKTPELHYLFGRAYAISGDHARAAVKFREALKTQPEYTEAVYGLARSLASSGRRAESLESFREFEMLHREDQRHLRQALELEQECIRQPGDTSVRLRAARYHFSRKNFAESRRYAWEALRVNPAQKDARLILARSLAKEGRYRESVLHYGRLLAKNPSNSVARRERDEILRKHARKRP